MHTSLTQIPYLLALVALCYFLYFLNGHLLTRLEVWLCLINRGSIYFFLLLFFFFLMYCKYFYLFFHSINYKYTYIFFFVIVYTLLLYIYCSCNHDKNFSKPTDSITIGIELCNIPHISEHWPKNEPSLFIMTEIWLSLPG